MKVSVYQVNLSFDEDETTLDDVLSSLSAGIEYLVQLGDYDELSSVEVER